MTKKKGVKFYNFKTILEMIGDACQSEGLHVSLNNEIVKDILFHYPFYSDNSAVFLIISGELKIQIDLVTYTVKANEIVMISAKSIVQVKEIVSPLKFCGLALTDDFALNNILGPNDTNILRLLAAKHNPVLSLNEKEKDVLYNLIKFLYELNLNSDAPFRAERISFYFNLIAYEILANFGKTGSLQIADRQKSSYFIRQTIHYLPD